MQKNANSCILTLKIEIEIKIEFHQLKQNSLN